MKSVYSSGGGSNLVFLQEQGFLSMLILLTFNYIIKIYNDDIIGNEYIFW